MALSFQVVQKAYKVFDIIKEAAFIDFLLVPERPEDMYMWDQHQRANPKESTVYGWDKKSDGGWESLFFFVSNPSFELIELFDSMKAKVPNSTLSEPYKDNKILWLFGWF